jgi:hypothetical protein
MIWDYGICNDVLKNPQTFRDERSQLSPIARFARRNEI